jgi:hypothetical protein
MALNMHESCVVVMDTWSSRSVIYMCGIPVLRRKLYGILHTSEVVSGSPLIFLP